MIYKLESIRITISKIVRDLGLGETEIQWQSMIEWIAEGLKGIGSYTQFTPKNGVITITDYKGELPCDFYKMIRIMDCHYAIHQDDYLIIDDVTTANPNPSTGHTSECSHNIIHDIMTIPHRNAVIKIKYLALPVDEQGFPMVPDDDEFRRALFWKVAYQLGIQGHEFKNAKLSDIEYTGRKWGTSKLSARAEANMPDPHLMEALKNGGNRLINDSNAFRDLFRNQGIQENLNLNGNY